MQEVKVVAFGTDGSMETLFDGKLTHGNEWQRRAIIAEDTIRRLRKAFEAVDQLLGGGCRDSVEESIDIPDIEQSAAKKEREDCARLLISLANGACSYAESDALRVGARHILARGDK